MRKSRQTDGQTKTCRVSVSLSLNPAGQTQITALSAILHPPLSPSLHPCGFPPFSLFSPLSRLVPLCTFSFSLFVLSFLPQLPPSLILFPSELQISPPLSVTHHCSPRSSGNTQYTLTLSLRQTAPTHKHTLTHISTHPHGCTLSVPLTHTHTAFD